MSSKVLSFRLLFDFLHIGLILFLTNLASGPYEISRWGRVGQHWPTWYAGTKRTDKQSNN